MLDAETEGQLGYILELELNNALRGREVAALLTQARGVCALWAWLGCVGAVRRGQAGVVLQLGKNSHCWSSC